MRICVVCLGNICRSPMAAAVLDHLIARAGLSEAVTVTSAGTGDWHIGEPADPRTLATLHERGLDGTTHRARRFTATEFGRYDLILAMDHDNYTTLRRMAPADADLSRLRMFRSFDHEVDDSQLDVPDPYYGGRDGFAHVLAQVERAAAGLVETLQGELSDG
jgi:protein-tyrosine phosphatase